MSHTHRQNRLAGIWPLGSNLRHIMAMLALMTAVACVPNDDNKVATRAMTPDMTLPGMKTFVSHQNGRTLRSNDDLSRDFSDLYFQMETGRELKFLSRFEGPISVRVHGQAPRTFPTDLSRLIQRLRNEAGLNIALSDRDDANITIHLLPQTTMANEVPGAACFVVPNVTGWTDFKTKRRAGLISWAAIIERKTATLFVPNNSSPQDLRDCLHEELAQALGPLNDLYRLPDSTFNDDNFHSVLTSFDMLMLRAAYDPALQSGMTRNQVMAKIPRILRRLNPAGERRAARNIPPTSPAYSQAITVALSNGRLSARQSAARDAIRLAKKYGRRDIRNGIAQYALGHLTTEQDPKQAMQSLKSADRIFKSLPDTAIHQAMAAEDMALIHLKNGDGKAVLRTIKPHIQTAYKHENAELLSTLLLLRAEGLDLTGQTSDAQTFRLDALGWARYGYGSDKKVFDRLKLIQSWNPTNG